MKYVEHLFNQYFLLADDGEIIAEVKKIYDGTANAYINGKGFHYINVEKAKQAILKKASEK